MSSSFLDILNKCRTPTVITLREALEERTNLSTSESNFITYMAGFSHHEFAAKLFDEFGLVFVDNTFILFDSPNNKFHVKILLNDQLDLESLDVSQISETYQLQMFTNFIACRNMDGSYVSNVYNEVKKFNRSQYDEYMSQHIKGLSEHVLSYETYKNGISFVIHLTTVQRNIDINLIGVFSRVSIAVFVNYYDDRPNLAIHNLRNKEEIYSLLSKIEWYVMDVEEPEEVTSFLEKIGAEYTLLPYMGEDHDYFHALISNIEVFMMQHCKIV